MFGVLVWRKSSHSKASGECVEVANWRKSSYSGAGKECVEVADVGSRSLVRDSKQPELGHLTFASGEWSTFVSSLKGAANRS
ncbi:DUF397 domain-containing protein [Nocardiopsis sp. NPDC049922]|uniref:DUF397 domain-containing protein n=1 Tax=Nocardiopsis sp. NPDC049922 TaxID=3155157 RepID=UPI00340CCFC7